MSSRLCVGAAALAVGALFCAEGRAGTAAPDLPVVEWSEGSPSLEDLRGQVTAVVFFDDSSS
jgi:hypothetical protein